MKFLPLALSVGLLASMPLWETQATAQGPQPAASYLTANSVQGATSGLTSDDNPYSDDQDRSILTIKKRVDEVNVVFSAMDSHGKFVKNLSQKDFEVRDNNLPPSSILDFRRETDLPLRVGLLVDCSGSVESRFTFEQDSAIQFLNQVVRAGMDKAFIVGFNQKSHLLQDFTDSQNELAKGVHSMHPYGGTALFDAVYNSSKDKLLHLDDAKPPRRALIVLSDGEDNQSDHSLQHAIQMAQRAEVTIYAISTDDSGMIMRGDNVLEQLASATGGRAFFPFKMRDITKAFSAIQEELRSQYSVAYKPAELTPDGRYHSIEIVAVSKKVHVRARPGYFAPLP
jgi:Ca-activated chloride channel family protein